jgi:hypothetical protein
MWVAIHKCMEAVLAISLYSYLYLKIAKKTMYFLLSLMFSLQQNWRTRGQNRFCSEVAGRGHKQCVYIWDKDKKLKWWYIIHFLLHLAFSICSIATSIYFYLENFPCQYIKSFPSFSGIQLCRYTIIYFINPYFRTWSCFQFFVVTTSAVRNTYILKDGMHRFKK